MASTVAKVMKPNPRKPANSSYFRSTCAISPNWAKWFQTSCSPTDLGMPPTKIFVSSEDMGPKPLGDLPLAPSLEPFAPPQQPPLLLFQSPPQLPPPLSPYPAPQQPLPLLSPGIILPLPLSKPPLKAPLQPLVPVACLTSIFLPWNIMVPDSDTALNAASASWKEMKAKPRKPPSGSYFMSMFMMAPYQVKWARRASSVVVFGRPPTKTFSGFGMLLGSTG
mmetsp:Transcript_39708/g.89558  ORF Transcript_39708/g.89558 Transcript_39708/m.89558 type:complete len:222 (-) Transcript_39708:530-1195(-)